MFSANLNASDRTARDRANAYLDARDRIAAPYAAKYPGRLPKRIARLIHLKTLKFLGQSVD
jgi:hypothetical protein